MNWHHLSVGGPYVANKDNLASLSSGGGKVGEGVRRDGASRRRSLKTTGATAAGRTSGEATTATEAETATTTTESSTAAEATTESSSHAAAVAAATAEAHSWTTAGVSVLTDLEDSSLPIVTIELLDGVASIIGALEHDDSGSLRPPVRANMDIGANDTAVSS